MEEMQSKTGELSFHGIDYILRFQCAEATLSIEIEQKSTGDIWRNTFNADYLEEITQKTGNFKKFPIFVKMLFTSLTKSSESVFLDILTFQDLQLLKSRKSTSASSLLPPSTKRYLILTYLVAFDKVHYPLPLNFEENPDNQTLKQTIKRLREEIEELRGNKGGMESCSKEASRSFFEEGGAVRAENETLKGRLRRYEEEGMQRKGAVEMDLIIKEKIDLEKEVEGVKQSSQKEINRLNTQLEETQQELEKKIVELQKIQHEYAASMGLDERSKRFKDHILKTNEENEMSLNSARKTLKSQEREMDKVQQELDFYKQQDKKQKLRIKQLENDLESALKKGSSKGVTDRLYSGSRLHSPVGSVSKRSTSVPHRSVDRKNSGMSNISKNKGKYSRDNSITSDSEYLSRWKRNPNPPLITSGKNTPQRKLPSVSIKKPNLSKSKPKTQPHLIEKVAHNSNKSKSKPYDPKPYTRQTLKTTSNLAEKKRDSSNKKNIRNINEKESDKKNYMKNSKVLSSINSSNSKEEQLFKKLDDLRNKNKRTESRNENNKENTENSIENIDERLNKLQNLLSLAKN